MNRITAWIYGRCPHPSCNTQYQWPRQKRKLKSGVCHCGRTLRATTGPFHEGCVTVYPKGRPGLTDPALAQLVDAKHFNGSMGVSAR